jgi:hypothetical protein
MLLISPALLLNDRRDGVEAALAGAGERISEGDLVMATIFHPSE